jgi:hypothetical protein
MKPLSWESLDWAALDRLRDMFLAGRPPDGSYWKSMSDLASYDFTYAQRIGWKWDAVLRELKLRHWSPPPGPLLDWGCGSGIASRRVLEHFGASSFERLHLLDQSALATQFAAARAAQMYAGIPVDVVSGTSVASDRIGTLVVSHVLNELNEAGGRALREAIDHADAVLWVEPGTFADSRGLIAMREALREQFHLIAPCTHQNVCGLLSPANERHWCHHFAPPPNSIMADSNWVRFAQRAGIDLRSLPYSFLVLERRGLREPVPGLLPDGWSRVLGAPRVYKGFARVLSCQTDGVRELELQKRNAPDVFKAMKSDEASALYRWNLEGSRITRILD